MQPDQCPYVIPAYTLTVYLYLRDPGKSAFRLRFKCPRLGILALGYRVEGLGFKSRMLAFLFTCASLSFKGCRGILILGYKDDRQQGQQIRMAPACPSFKRESLGRNQQVTSTKAEGGITTAFQNGRRPGSGNLSHAKKGPEAPEIYWSFLAKNVRLADNSNPSPKIVVSSSIFHVICHLILHYWGNITTCF